MIYASHIYRQSSLDFFRGMQEEVYNTDHLKFPAAQEEIADLQATYWMGGEL